MRARKRFGQHFLTDESMLQGIADAMHFTEHDRVMEIGPGQGALTQLLADAPQTYVAVEIDRDLVPLLRATYPQLQIVNDDILRVDLVELLAPGKAWRIFGNLPYNISSPLIAKLTEFIVAHRERVADLHFMLQKEMADRLAAAPGTKAWGRLSVMVQLYFDVEFICDVPPESFTPPPRVWSSVIRMIPRQQRPEVDVPTLDRLLRVAFAGRRKRLSNSLKMLNIDWSSTDIDPGVRADNVSAAQYVALAGLVRAEPEQG